MSKVGQFWQWVESELETRGLNYYRVEQRQGLGNGTISRPARYSQEPSLTVCQALARAFHLPLEEVLRRAGHLPPSPTTPLTAIPRLQEFVTVLQDLPPQRQRQVMELALMLLELTGDADAETPTPADVLPEPPEDAARDG